MRERAKIPDETGPRGGARYRCAECGGSFPATKTQIDHLEPVIPLDTPAKEMSFDEIINRMWCPIDNLQCVCVECHKIKSKAENAERRRIKKEKKQNEA